MQYFIFSDKKKKILSLSHLKGLPLICMLLLEFFFIYIGEVKVRRWQ